MSRSSKCREISQSDLAAPSARPLLHADEALLRRLARLRQQTLEVKYKRKLEAVTLFLQWTDKRLIEDRANASLRTVQRWARQARQFGPEILCSRAGNYAISKLSEEQLASLTVALKGQSADPTGTPSHWSASRLMRHISDNYGVRYSLRHCRRLLVSLGVAKRRAVRPPAQKPQRSEIKREEHQEAKPIVPSVGDYERKRRSIARIKRLASSGLPLQAFVYTLFDLVHDAVPYDQTSPGLTVEANGETSWITRNFDYSRWFSSMQKYVLEATPEISGFNPPALLPWNPSTVLCHEQMARPDFHRSAGYNEFFRQLGVHHGVLTVLRDDEKRFLGYYPVFRSDRMKPFGRDDFAFFNAAAAHIAYGVNTAALIAQTETAKEDTFEPFHEVPHGVVVTDRNGKVLSLNRVAHSIFRQFALYDGWGSQRSVDDSVETLSRYIASQLRSIFGNFETAAEANVPSVRIYSHRSGAALRLSGHISNLGNHEHFSVFVEFGETEPLLRRRFAIRYALSPRQAELLMLLRRGASRGQITEFLQVSPSALKASLRELRLKLDLTGSAALRRFALNSGYSMSSSYEI